MRHPSTCRSALALAALLMTASCADTGVIPESAMRPGAVTASTGTAAILLSNNRAIINPAALGGLDLSRDVWLAWDGNEYLSLFEQEDAYLGLRPGSHHKLVRRTDGWYETPAPVAGARFTALQFAGDGRTRIWAQLPPGWAGVSQTPQRYECGHLINPGYSVSLHLPRAGYPTLTYNGWIQKTSLPGDTTQLFLSKYLLPVDPTQLSTGWKLVGERIGWTVAEGLDPISGTGGLTFRIGGTKNGGRVNVTARAIARPAQPSGSSAWGRFGHLKTGELDGYSHPYIYLNCAEFPNYGIVGINLP
jgi:hypothetical protein